MSTNDEGRDKVRLLGVLTGILSSTSLTFSGLCVQQLHDRDITNFQLVFLRMIPHFFMSSIWLIKTQGKVNPVTQSQVRANAFNLMNSVMYCFSVLLLVVGLRTMAGMGSIYSIMNSGRLLLVVILARIFLKETINMMKVLTVMMSVAGIVSVTQPELIFQYVKSSVLLQPLWSDNDAARTDQQITNVNSTISTGTTDICTTITIVDTSNNTADIQNSIPPIWQGYVFVFIDAFNISIMTITTSILVKRTTSSAEMFFNMSAVGIFVTGIGMCFDGFKTPDNLRDILCIAGYSLGSIGYNIGYIITMKLVPASLASILFTFTIVLGVVLQYTIFHNSYSGHSNILEILGCCLVIVSILLVPAQQLCHDRNKDKLEIPKQIALPLNKDVALRNCKTFEFPQLFKSNK